MSNLKKLPWSRVGRAEVERASRFPSVAALNILQAANNYKEPVFYSLHIAAFCVMERRDANNIFQLGTVASRAKQADGQKRRWSMWRRKRPGKRSARPKAVDEEERDELWAVLTA